MKGDKTPEEYLRECLALDDFALDEEFIRMPADMAYWTALYAEAMRAWMLAKFEHERNAARLHHRTKAANDLGGQAKKATVGDLEALVLMDPDYEVTYLALVDAEVEKVRLRGVVDAIATKKDMLQSLGAKLRAEMGGDPMIRAEHKERRSRG
jgi:hypothetical protein